MESRAKLNHILEDAINVIKAPAEFYRQMPKTGGLSDPIIFVLVMAVVMGLTVAVFSLMGAGVIGAMAVGFGAIITVPIFAVIGSFISAAILFVIWKLMGSTEQYATAYRCVAYATAIYPIMAVLGLIPYLGTIVGISWGVYLMITASKEVHQLDQTKCYIVFGIIGALLLVMNVSSEIASRKMAAQVEKYSEQLEAIDEMTPEEAGKALGGFIEGLNEAARKAEKSAQGVNESAAASSEANTEALSTQVETTSNKAMTPADAGKALGDFFSGFEQATRKMREQTGQQATGEAAASAGESVSATASGLASDTASDKASE